MADRRRVVELDRGVPGLGGDVRLGVGELAARVAVEFDLPYPVELERILLDRFAELPDVGPAG